MYITLEEQSADIKNLISTMSLLFKNYLHVEVMYLLIICNENKLFPWNTNNTDGNGEYKQNIYTCTPNTQR